MKDERETLDARLARLRAETEGTAPPHDFAARIAARVAARPARPPLLRFLGPAAVRAVPLAALAAAAAFALSWAADRQLEDGAASVVDLVQGVP